MRRPGRVQPNEGGGILSRNAFCPPPSSFLSIREGPACVVADLWPLSLETPATDRLSPSQVCLCILVGIAVVVVVVVVSVAVPRDFDFDWTIPSAATTSTKQAHGPGSWVSVVLSRQ